MFDQFYNFNFETIFKVLQIIIVFIIIYVGFNFIFNFFEKRLFKRVKTKKEKSNVRIFFDVARYVLLIALIIFAIFTYAGSLTGIGIVAGLLSAALGWALQRPITGIAAWLMVVVQRPFEIGDRIIIGSIKGDVIDVTLTHIHIREIGGTIASEEISGRIILIPNAKLFEQDIINYTKEKELILDQVKFTITFDSDLNKGIEIGRESAQKVLQPYSKKLEAPYTRTWFQPSGIDIYIRYFVPAQTREEVSSQITQKIFEEVNKTPQVNFAYPHIEVILRKK